MGNNDCSVSESVSLVDDLDAIAADPLAQAMQKLIAWVDAPGFAELEQRFGARRLIFHRNRALPSAEGLQQLKQLFCQ